MSKYIDVSSHQGTINFEELKGNVDGIIIRAGYGGNHIDTQFERNVSECNRLDIPCGAYWFSYAYTVEMAANEAKNLLDAVRPYTLELPLAFDYEYDSVRYSKQQGVDPSIGLVRDMTNAFCETIENAGYWCMLYTNRDYIDTYFGSLAGGRYDLWYAAWPKQVDITNPPCTCGIWQWGSSFVPGINGKVDTNESYKDYPTFLRSQGKNHLESSPEPQSESIPWYSSAISWAKDIGINDGSRPDDTATRAEVTQMLYNFYKIYIQ